MEEQFDDKTVLLVDESIVRGTLSKEIVNMATEAGAKGVYFASCSPHIRHPHIYGIFSFSITPNILQTGQRRNSFAYWCEEGYLPRAR